MKSAQQFCSWASSATWWHDPSWLRAAFHGRTQRIPTGTRSQVLLQGCRKQGAAANICAVHVCTQCSVSEKCSATKPMFLQKGKTFNSDFLAYETEQLQTPKCQKMSQQFITFMTTSSAQEKLRFKIRTCSQAQDSKQRSERDALIPACK